MTVHCEVVRQKRLKTLLEPITQRVLARAHILVTSHALRSIPLLEPHLDRVEVIPLGVDLQRFRPRSRTPDPLPLVPRPRVLYVGQLRHYKGLDVLSAALARLPEATLVVVGDGPERSSFEHDLHVLGCRERVHFLGRVGDDELVAIMQSVDVAVLASTSRAEAFGLAVAEAQACGIPAVTTEVGTGTSLTVSDGFSGRVVGPRDAAALADAIGWCLEPHRASDLRLAARAHAENKLSAEVMTDRVVQVYVRMVRRQERDLVSG